MTIPVFIGYDPREAVAFHVCVNSIIRQTKELISIRPLALNLLSHYQETHTDGSNHFIYSRFLVPELMNYQGWAIFIDGDMILRDDISQLWNLRDDKYDVMVVKHNYTTRTSVKYLGSPNYNYPRKNWSSVILWNCSSPNNRCLTAKTIEQSTGAHLHRFAWLNDEKIGSLPVEWNWLPDEFGVNKKAKLLHFTLGTPCFHDYADSPQSEEWFREQIFTNYCQQKLS